MPVYSSPLSDTFYNSFQYTWLQVAAFVPRFIAALIILIIGILIAIGIGRLVRRLIMYTHIDSLLIRTGWRDRLDKYEFRYTFADVIGGAVRWFFYLITFVTVSDILAIPELTRFLLSVVYYIPNVIVAVIILVVGLVAGRFVGGLVYSSLELSTDLNMNAASMVGAVARWAVFLFSALAALLQLGIAEGLLQILFAGVVIMLALAGGLAFGLGGRDKASQLLQNISRNASRRQAGGGV